MSKPIQTFFISDMHFGHANVLNFERKTRNFNTIQEHDKHIVKVWNHYIRPEDVVYVLGDISMTVGVAYLTDIISQLNGKKVLVLGNHDKLSMSAYYKLGFAAVLRECKMSLNKNHIVKLSHFPYSRDKNEKLQVGRLFSKFRPRREDMWLLRGHTHSNGPKVDPYNREINVGWDQWQRPVSTDNILECIHKSSKLSIIEKIIAYCKNMW